MKKMYNWLKKDDRFWWILIITVILAIIIARCSSGTGCGSIFIFGFFFILA